jgi:hypothetical protein
MADLSDEARRLSLASALNRHANEHLVELAAETSQAMLLVAARSLAGEVEDFEQRHRVRFEPGFPGDVAGPERSGPRARVLLTCMAYDRVGRAVGRVFTTLIAGRRPSVSVAPPDARVH